MILKRKMQISYIIFLKLISHLFVSFQSCLSFV
uniref:Uncharacterized protein n=1 Tax=Rhizophora mucronata TaxID=61149 RepID=A0A2P2IYE6_RHIMU